MSMTALRRAATTSTVAAGALVLMGGAAFAHDCYVGTGSTNGPNSDKWHSITAEDGAGMMLDVVAECPEQSAAGYAALKAAGLPASIKIFVGGPERGGHFLLGEKSQATSDGKGLEHFTADSPLAFDMITTWAEGATSVTCGA